MHVIYPQAPSRLWWPSLNSRALQVGVFNAHALRSEHLGVVALCWRHDAFADVVTVPGPLLLLGPVQGSAFECSLGLRCELPLAGVGLSVKNVLRLRRDCATAVRNYTFLEGPDLRPVESRTTA